MPNLSSSTKIESALATTGAGTSEIDGAGIDMQGYEGVLFVAKYGTAAAGNFLQGQQSTDNSSFADLEGTAVGVGSSDEIVFLDIHKPQEQFVRVQAQRGTSSTLDWGIALKYGARKQPVDNTVAGTIHGELSVSPSEGTV